MNLIQLWKLKADVAQGSPFAASEDLSQLTFNIMEAAALGVDATETSMARHLAKLREARLPKGSGGNALVEFPDWEESDLLEALHAFENAAGRALVAPSPWLFHVFNNLFSSRLRKARAARKAARKFAHLCLLPRLFPPSVLILTLGLFSWKYANSPLRSDDLH